MTDVNKMSKGEALMELYNLGALKPEQSQAIDEAKRRGVLDQIINRVDGEEIEDIGSPGFIGSVRQDPIDVGQIASQIARPTLQAVGGAGGAMVGSGAAPIAGTLAGGGLGFAAGDELADLFDEFLGLRERKPLMVELKESAGDIAEGAIAEAGGQVIGKAIGPTLKFVGKFIPKIPFSKAALEKKAADVIAANTNSGPLIAKNIDEARALEEAIPGLKFGRGQLTNDPSVIKFERAAARGPGEVAEQRVEQTASNSKALRNFIDKQKGGAGIGEVIEPLAKQEKVIGEGVGVAGKQLEMEAAGLGRGTGKLEAGEQIRAAAGEARGLAKEKAGELFEEIPEFDIDANSLVTKIDELSKPMSKFEKHGNIPESFGLAREVLEETGGVSTPQDLQGLRSSLTDDLRDIQSSAAPNKRKAARISQLIGEVDDVLQKAGEVSGDSQAKYKGQIIYPGKLKKELLNIDKKLQAEPKFAGEVVDVEKTYKELKDAKEIGIMQQVQERAEAYSKRLAKVYKLKFGKDAPIEPIVEKAVVKIAKKRKAEIGEMLSESVGIKPESIKASAGKLKTAQQFYKKEVIEKFEQGAVGDILKKGRQGNKVSNAQIASKFFKPGPQGKESAQQFINSVGDNAQARQAIEDAVSQDLLEKSINPTTGEIVETKLKGWLTKNNDALSTLGIKDKFNSVVKARGMLDEAIQTQTEFGKSAASKLLKSDVDTAVRNAFSVGPKGSSAKSLMAKLRGDKKAVSGLQNSIIDHIIDTAETTTPDAFDNMIISPAKLQREYQKFKPAIRVAFKDSPQKLRAFDQYRSALKTLQRGKASPLGGGSDTAENILTAISNTGGLSASRTLNIVKAAIKPFKDLSDNHVNAILNRAAFDPDFAFTLFSAAKGRAPDLIEMRLKGHLAALGIRSTKTKKDKK